MPNMVCGTAKMLGFASSPQPTQPRLRNRAGLQRALPLLERSYGEG
ncbi:hypothetical protein [Rhodanobacter fulvus]|nr:hypothetical protein [Rhodanobacter fulvus]